jgi:predicted O-methyltransferase YrrM
MTRYEVLAQIINEAGFRNIAEVGVRNGETTTHLLTNCNLFQYFLVDCVQNDELYHSLCQDRVSFLLMKSNEAVQFIKDGCLDLVFIDADHSYEACLQDIALWYPKVRDGGVICGHDYLNSAHQGVERAVKEFFGDKPIITYGDGAYMFAHTKGEGNG